MESWLKAVAMAKLAKKAAKIEKNDAFPAPSDNDNVLAELRSFRLFEGQNAIFLLTPTILGPNLIAIEV